MDRLAEVLARFEAEYMDPRSITPQRRIEQFRLLCRFAAGLDHPLEELTARDIQLFVGAEIARGVSPNTVRKYQGMIRSFITWASAAGMIDPLRTSQLRSVGNARGSSASSTPKPYTPAEIGDLKKRLAQRFPASPMGKLTLRRWQDGEMRALRRGLWKHCVRVQLEAQIALALELGLRKIEIMSLTIPTMHYDNDQIVVLTAKQGPGLEPTRVVPFTAHARQCVQEWLDLRLLLMPDHDRPWLYLAYYGERAKQLSPLPAWKMQDALRRLLGPEWEWHRLRHTAATEWLRAGMPLEKLRVLMGHANIEQTLAYAKIASSDLDEAMGRAEASFSQRLGIAA